MRRPIALLAWLALTSSAHAADTLFTSTAPAQREVSIPGDLTGVSEYFVELTDGTFGIEVLIATRTGRFSPIHRGVVFRPVSGTLHRVGNELLWSVKGHDIVVATHDWYYFPAWLTSPRVQLGLRFDPTTPAGGTYRIATTLRAN